MPQLDFTLRTATPSTPCLSPVELRRDFLTGLPHQRLSDQALRGWLLAAERTVEQTLGIKLARQLVTEDLDLWVEELRVLQCVRTSFPVVVATELLGGVSEIAKTRPWPLAWLQARRTSEPTGYERKIFVIPNGPGESPLAYQFTFGTLMLTSQLTYAGVLPRYWRISYLTGYDKLPEELVQLIGNLASIPALYKMANMVLPAGLTSQSISLDGLSQNLSANDPFGKTIQGYLQYSKDQLEQLGGAYRGLSFSSI